MNPYPKLEFRQLTPEELSRLEPLDGFLSCASRDVEGGKWFIFHYRPGELDNANWID